MTYLLLRSSAPKYRSFKRRKCSYRRVFLHLIAKFISFPDVSSPQAQVVVHGGLPPILAMAAKNDPNDNKHAAMALGNIAANEGNHPQMVAQWTIQTLVELSQSPEADVREYAGFALANMASNTDYLDMIGSKGGIEPLVKLARSANVHIQASPLGMDGYLVQLVFATNNIVDESGGCSVDRT